MALITVGVNALPEPSTYTLDSFDLSTNAERTADGTLRRNVIARKVKLNLTWAYMTQTELASLMSKVSADSFTVSYWDYITNSTVTALMYCGDKSAGVLTFKSGVIGFNDIKFNLIEI